MEYNLHDFVQMFQLQHQVMISYLVHVNFQILLRNYLLSFHDHVRMVFQVLLKNYLFQYLLSFHRSKVYHFHDDVHRVFQGLIMDDHQ